jgi:hypothetical protein
VAIDVQEEEVKKEETLETQREGERERAGT